MKDSHKKYLKNGRNKMVKYGLCYRNKKEDTRMLKILLKLIKVMKNYTESEEENVRENKNKKKKKA